MSKNSQFSAARQSDPGCEICYCTNEETMMMVSSTIQSLFLLGDTLKPEDPLIDNGGFKGLLKMIFGVKYKNFKETMKCSHQRLQNEFLTVLEIPLKELNLLANIKITQKARYNYHIDVISSQVKAFPRHYPYMSKSEKVISIEKSPVHTEKTVSPPKKLPNLSQPNISEKIKIKNEESEVDKPRLYPVNYDQGIQFGNQFDQCMNNLFMMTFGIHNPPPQ